MARWAPPDRSGGGLKSSGLKRCGWRRFDAPSPTLFIQMVRVADQEYFRGKVHKKTDVSSPPLKQPWRYPGMPMRTGPAWQSEITTRPDLIDHLIRPIGSFLLYTYVFSVETTCLYLGSRAILIC